MHSMHRPLITSVPPKPYMGEVCSELSSMPCCYTQARMTAVNQRLTSQLAAAGAEASQAPLRQQKDGAKPDPAAALQEDVVALRGELCAARRQAALTDGLCDRLQVWHPCLFCASHICAMIRGE